MNQLFKRHYQAIVDRGLIKPSTTDIEFLEKAKEELKEWSEDFNPNEAIDTIGVIVNWLIHNGYDIEKLYKENVIHQETRKD